MSVLGLYFTRTGNCKTVAEKIGSKAEAELSQITDDVNWKGVFGFLRGGRAALTGRTTTPIFSSNKDLNEYDKVFVVAPMWAGGLPPAVMGFLENEIKDLKEFYFICVNGGSEFEPFFEKLQKRVGRIEHLYGIKMQYGNKEQLIEQIADKLK